MNDAQVRSILAEGLPVEGLLVVRAGWIAGYRFTFQEAFQGEPTLWRVSAYTGDGEYLRDLFVEAENIIGISVRRGNHGQEL